MSKYYTPKIEEFHVGFEYEVLDFALNMQDKAFRKDIITIVSDIANARDWLSDGEIRVKYLDNEDIKSLGFVDRGMNRYTTDEFIIVGGGNNPNFYYILNRIDQEGSFAGIIKNKSELGKILKMIGVLQDD